MGKITSKPATPVLPTWLIAARRAYSLRPPDPTPPSAAAPGDVWLIEDARGKRAFVAIVMAGDGVETGPAGMFSVVLVHNELDLATSQSLTYRASETGAPFDFVVQNDIVFPIWRNLLVSRAGVLPGGAAGLLAAAHLGEFTPSLDSRRGMPLRGRADPRWGFLEDLADEIDSVAAPFVE